jgi:hypothetical protein
VGQQRGKSRKHHKLRRFVAVLQFAHYELDIDSSVSLHFVSFFALHFAAHVSIITGLQENASTKL